MKSEDRVRNYISDVAQEYFDDYISIKKNYYGDLNLEEDDITDLGGLENVDGNLSLYKTKITDLGNLRRVGGYLALSHTKITSLGKLEYVGGILYLVGVDLTSLGNLKYVDGSINCTDGSDTHKLLMDSDFADQIKAVKNN